MNTNKSAPKRSKFGLIFGSAWVIMALPFLGVSIYTFKLERRYEATGQKATGTVLHKESRESYNSKEKRAETSYYVDYRFKTSSGQELTNHSSVGSSTWQSLNENSPVEIQYLSDDPSKNRVATESSYTLSIVFGIVSLIMIGLGGSFLVYDLKKRATAKRLMRDGTLTDATVSDIRLGNLTINNVTQMRIHFSFKDSKGALINGCSEHLAPQAAKEWKSGDNGKVKYDKANSENYIWLGA